MFEQLPSSGASNQSVSSLSKAGQQGPEGGAPASAGPTYSDTPQEIRPAVECAPVEARSPVEAGAHSFQHSPSAHVAANGASAEAMPPANAGAPIHSQSPLGSHQGEGASSPADEIPTQPSAGSQDAPPVTFGGVPVRAMEDVMACRHEQIFKHGHTPEKDRETPLWCPREFDPRTGNRSMMRELTRQLSSAIEYAARGQAHHAVARRALVRLAALCLAAIDWIDAEAAERGREP